MHDDIHLKQHSNYAIKYMNLISMHICNFVHDCTCNTFISNNFLLNLSQYSLLVEVVLDILKSIQIMLQTHEFREQQMYSHAKHIVIDISID